MDEAALDATVARILKNDVILNIIRDQVKTAVDAAVAERNAEIKALKEELAETRTQLNTLEQYSRRLCLDISGVPESAGEDTDRLVIDTAKLAGVDISKADIDRSHRVGRTKPGKPRTLVVRLASYTKREALYGARRQLREPRHFDGSTVTAETARRVFVSDNLTRENHLILYTARQYRKEGKLHSAWSDVGKLKVRLREGGPTTVIQSLADLQKHVGDGAARQRPTEDDGFRRVTRSRK